jgi:hypothetical protein
VKWFAKRKEKILQKKRKDKKDFGIGVIFIGSHFLFWGDLTCSPFYGASLRDKTKEMHLCQKKIIIIIIIRKRTRASELKEQI